METRPEITRGREHGWRGKRASGLPLCTTKQKALPLEHRPSWRSRGLTGAGPAAATGLFHPDRGLAVGAGRPQLLVTVDPVTIQQGLAIWQAGHRMAPIRQGPDVPGLQRKNQVQAGNGMRHFNTHQATDPLGKHRD